MTKSTGKIGVIGAGVMGQALVRALLAKGVVKRDDLWVGNRRAEKSAVLARELGVDVTSDYAKLVAKTDTILLCVKPAQIAGALAQLKGAKLAKNTLVISIAAGVEIAKMEKALPAKQPVVRAMPNTPCVVGEGVTAVCGGTHATPAHLAIAREIFASVGLCLELEEKHFDAVTGLSGSGPAYFFLIMEALADGGVRVGLPRELALQMVVQTMLGSARMVQAMGRHPAALRDDVTTPAGCTIGALLVMEDGRIRSILARAIEEAAKIAGKLGETK